MVTFVAFFVLHERVDELPSIIDSGFALKYSITGRISSGTTGSVGVFFLQVETDRNKDKHMKHKSVFLII